MTAAARISQQDVDRALKGVARAGIERARIVLDLKNQRIEVIIGESARVADQRADDDYSDED